MCQMCDYRRDMATIQGVITILETIDFENLYLINDLVARMMYTMETSDEDADVLKILDNVPKDPETPIAKAMVQFVPVARSFEEALRRIDDVSEDLKQGIEQMLGHTASPEDAEDGPPSAFTDFFTGGE